MNSDSEFPSDRTSVEIYGWNPRQHLAGFRVGVVCIDSAYPIVAGNMQHASTYPFPVLFGIVRDVSLDLLLSGNPELAGPVIATCHKLVDQGVKAIVGACGSFAYYQQSVSAELPVPVCMSVLVQVPFLLSVLPQGKRLLVYFAAARAFTPRVQQACGIERRHLERLVIREAISLPAFQALTKRPSSLNPTALTSEICEDASSTVASHSDIGGILLQCSDLPPCAGALQRRTGLPVFDGTLVVNWLVNSLDRKDYSM